MSDLWENPFHGGVTDVEMEQFFAEHPDLQVIQPVGSTRTMEFERGAAEPPLGGEEGEPTEEPSEPSTEEPAEPDAEPTAPPEGEPTGPEGEPAGPEGPAEPSTDDFFDIGGQRYTRTQIEAATQFQQHLVSDVELQNLIRNYLAGSAIQQVTSTASPAGDGSAPAGPPQELDLDDPQIAALYGIVQQQNEALGQLRMSQQQMLQSQQSAQRSEINSIWQRTSTSFAKDHDLEIHDVENLGRIAARLGVAPQLMSGVDPITGSPVAPDPMKAMERSLEIAMMMVPEYRDREFKRSVTTQQEQAKKRKLLGAVGGSSGSVARTTPPPQPGTPEAKRAMLQEVGSMLNGEWSDPTAN
jgi:hypothetical protein